MGRVGPRISELFEKRARGKGGEGTDTIASHPEGFDRLCEGKISEGRVVAIEGTGCFRQTQRGRLELYQNAHGKTKLSEF